ncbi:MAG: TonB-dependent receptor, partial [Pseudomonadales bacterium]
VRGPATLLYGNGAIGGVVNVIDNRIGTALLEAPEVQLEQRRNTASNQNSSVVDINGAIGPVALHFDGFYRNSEDLKIKGLAINTAALDLTGEELDELDNTFGYIANSDVEASGIATGASFIFDQGYLGYSVSRLDNQYGLPPGVHEHHHEEEEGTHDEEEEDEAQVLVRLSMKQTRQDVRGAWYFDAGRLESLELKLTHNDYQHEELEIEVGALPVVGTRFENKGFEGRLTISHEPLAGWQGVAGMQVIDRTFSASGDEAYIPKSDINSIGLFLVESYEAVDWTTELGARFERQKIDPSASCRKTSTSMSFGASVIRALPQGNLLVSLQRAERSPTVEEHFSNVDAITCQRQASDEALVLHASTRLFEIGSRNLNAETSNNIELGFRKTRGSVTGELNLYYNRINDY